MQESLSTVPVRVREQLTILEENIETLTRVKQEVGPGPVSDQVDREFLHHLHVLGELRERAFNGVVSGSVIIPLEEQPARIEILDLLSFSIHNSSEVQINH